MQASEGDEFHGTFLGLHMKVAKAAKMLGMIGVAHETHGEKAKTKVGCYKDYLAHVESALERAEKVYHEPDRKRDVRALRQHVIALRKVANKVFT